MSDNRIIECMERAQYLLGNLMAVKPGEEVLIVVDPQTDERMTQAMAAAALNCGAEYGVYMMPIRTWTYPGLYVQRRLRGREEGKRNLPHRNGQRLLLWTAGTLDRTYRHGTVQSDRYLRRGNTRRGYDCKRRQGCLVGRQIKLLHRTRQFTTIITI